MDIKQNYPSIRPINYQTTTVHRAEINSFL